MTMRAPDEAGGLHTGPCVLKGLVKYSHPALTARRRVKIKLDASS